MKITIQRTMNVPAPTRAHETDAGLDLYIPEGQGCLIRPGAVYTIDLGVRVAIPDGYCGQLALRSSAGKKGLAIPNGIGVIDSGYRGDLKVLVVALAEPVLVSAGERICQFVIQALPAVEVEMGAVDGDTDRGTGGLGSTGIGVADSDYGTQAGGGLTIGRLMGQLQDAASRYGNDTPIGILADSGFEYEQAAVLSVVNAIKIGRAGGWNQYRADTDGNPVAVIS